MMSSVVNDSKGTGTAAKFKNSNMPVVGKTGTTTNTKDLTFVGYTPYYVGSIWFGYDRYDTTVPNMDKFLSNQHCHLDVWRNVMERIHQGLEVKDFPQPDGITEVTICKTSGMLPNSGCETMTEYFADGTQPTKHCTGHSGSYSDGESDSSSSSHSSSSSSDNTERDTDTDNDTDNTSTDSGTDTSQSSSSSSEQSQAPSDTSGSNTGSSSTEQASQATEQPAAAEPTPEPEPTPAPEPAATENVIVEPTVSAG
jgi:penicillin-binding protein 1A